MRRGFANRVDASAKELARPLVLKMPRRLESPNSWQGRHWRVKHRLSQEWEKAIGGAMVDHILTKARRAGNHNPKPDFPLALLCMMGPRGAAKVTKNVLTPRRYRVLVERAVPSTRNFIRDDDNLRFAVKPLLDALKRQGYIYNDSRKWLDHPTPTQRVSEDGKDYTIVTIEPIQALVQR